MTLSHAPAVMAAAPVVIQHTFPQLWTIFWSWVVGLVCGVGLMGWYKNVGVKGMITDVKNDVSTIKTDVENVKQAVTPKSTAQPASAAVA